MPVRAWRFKSSHPHSETRLHPPSVRRPGRRRALRRRLGRARAPDRDDRGRRDAEGAAARGVRTLAAVGARHARLPAPARRGAGRARRRGSRTRPGRAGPLALPARRERLRRRRPALAGRSARAASPASPRSGRTSATTRCATRGGPQQIGADKLWGANLETAGNGMKIGIIDDGLDATHPYFNPSGFQYPPGFPKGQTQVHDAEGDRAAHVRAAVADLEVREHAVRPDELVPRDARRGHRRRRPRRAARRGTRSPASRRTRTSATTRR